MLALTGRPAGQDPPAARIDPPPLRSGIDLVLVDTTVVDRQDRPVEGLSRGDFIVKVDGAPRPVASLEYVRSTAAVPDRAAPGAPPPASAGSRLAGRTFVIVVDREKLPAVSGVTHIEAAAGFLDTLGPQDRVALFTLPTPASQLVMRSDFQAVKNELRALKKTVSQRPSCIVIHDEEAHAIATWHDRQLLAEVTSRECGKRCPDESECLIEQRARLQDADNEAGLLRTLEALRALMAALAAIEGPKHVVLVTGGSYAAPERAREVRAIAESAARGRVQIHAIQAWKYAWGMSPEQGGGAAMPQPNQSLTAEVGLAEFSGGTWLTTIPGKAGFERLQRRMTGWYVIGVETTAADRDGRAHAISVEVPGRRDITVRARKEFEVKATPSPAPVTTAASIAAAPEVPPAATASPAPSPAPAALPGPATAPGASPGASTLETTSVAESVAPDPETRGIVRRMADYVARYGEEASLFVASEEYHQRIEVQTGRMLRPRTLTSEFALVRGARSGDWVGYRDVVEVDGKQIADRKDRLQALLTETPEDQRAVRRLVEESARFNVGPVSRDFNTPTTVLLFFHPSRVSRFSFKSRGTKSVDGQRVVQLDFVETARPTLIGKRDGTDVPSSGAVWVNPEDGTVVRTRVRLRKFADGVQVNDSFERGVREPAGTTSPPVVSQPVQAPAAPQAPPPTTGGGAAGGGTTGGGVAGGGTGGSSGGGGSGASGGATAAGTTAGDPGRPPAPRLNVFDTSVMEILESLADVEVTFRRDPQWGTWLPWKMSELYEGAIPVGTRSPVLGKATATAEYTKYRRFGTSATIVEPK